MLIRFACAAFALALLATVTSSGRSTAATNQVVEMPNGLKYTDTKIGDGATAKLRLWRDRKSVRFSVSDDGVGFLTRNRAAQGAGLTNMTDRIGAVGGTLTVRSAPGEGTTVLGAVVLSETVHWNQPVGAVVLLSGIAISQGRLWALRPRLRESPARVR